MPAKRSLQIEEEEEEEEERNTPHKRHIKDATYSPLTGTKPMTPTAKTQAGNYKTSGSKGSRTLTQEPQTETERMDFLRSKFEGSLEALMKTRQELMSLLPVEGNSELRSFLLMGPADLHKELRRHKELSSKVIGGVNGTQVHEKRHQVKFGIHPTGVTQTGSSYEFLKNILSG